MDANERKLLARKRLTSVLTRHGIANLRTLEQKIADAGPNNQRIDPHVLTPVRKDMEEEGIIARRLAGGNTWYFLGNSNPVVVDARLAAQVADFRAFTGNNIQQRVGQALEIATYRALTRSDAFEFFGRFPNLDVPNASGLYPKQEPPSYIGGMSLDGDQALDFLVRHPEAGYLGLECKNIREWLYPHRDEIQETLVKCIQLNCVPVLIARRFPFVTFKLLSACGVIVHQTFNQLMADQDAAVAERVKHKESLGYHDIRVGNQPDARLQKFIGTDMPSVAVDARARFEQFKDLLWDFGRGEMSYPAFAARVRRRLAGRNEDNDNDEPDGSEFEGFEFD